MDAELKAKWTAALRSGEYKQGVGTLRNDIYTPIRFCCLGVLREVAHLPEANYATVKALLQMDYDVFLKINDVERRPFAAIADYIDLHL